MHIFVVGLDHHTSPVEVRERLAFRPSRMAAAFAALRDDVGLREAAILSTCNRVEVYGVADDPQVAAVVQSWLHTFHNQTPHSLDQSFYTHTDAVAVHHLFGT